MRLTAGRVDRISKRIGDLILALLAGDGRPSTFGCIRWVPDIVLLTDYRAGWHHRCTSNLWTIPARFLTGVAAAAAPSIS
jgi:hypothetical protein